MKLDLLFAGVLILRLSVVGYAQTPNKAKLDQFFDRFAEKNKAMGSPVIAENGNVLHNRSIGYGQINGAEKKPLTAESRFCIGSITKMFMATMTLKLVEEGKLKLTDTLDNFFPLIPNANKITIAQQLAHHSGIPNVRRERDSQRNVNTPPMTKEEMFSLIVKGTPDLDPDTKHLYSNTGYWVLDLLLEKLTGKSYEEALRKGITSKTGLKDTYTATGTIDVNKNEALTYMNLGSDWPIPAPSIRLSACLVLC